jgi:hypothetical protein
MFVLVILSGFAIFDHGLCVYLHPTMSEKRAIATLTGAVLLSTLTIGAVHFQQHQEREVTSNATVSLI